MASAELIKALFRSYSEADGDKFLSVATQITAHAAKLGNTRVASDLKKLVDEIRHKQRTAKIGGAVPIVRPAGELGTILSVSYPKTRLSEMVLGPEQSEDLKRVVHEYRQQDKLRQFALSARRKLLLVGPPGCGKATTSQALAGELSLPHFSVQLHALITKFMEETTAKIHTIFETMQETRGIYLFDEFEAIGGTTNHGNEDRKIQRVLNSFLTFLEEDRSDSIVVAATDKVGMLDPALFRRFDDIIVYHHPDQNQAQKLVRNRLAPFGAGELEWGKISKSVVGLSHAEICRACDETAKSSILNDTKISDNAIIRAIHARKDRLEFYFGNSIIVEQSQQQF